MNIPGRPARSARWKPGHALRLLENGEEFFPAVFEAVGAARREVLIETFILFEDKVGLELHATLIAAAQRGVQVDLTIDGYGSPDLSPQYVSALTEAGVRIHVFDPSPRIWGCRTNLFRRMHRKLVVVDSQRAFVGGINYSADQLADFGPTAKLDHAVELEGPIVEEIGRFARAVLATTRAHRPWFARRLPQAPQDVGHPAGDAAAIFVTRDNCEHTNDIERHYRVAICAARKRVWIANAYFFPGYRLLHQMRRAARRGVDVRIVLQGEPDMPIVKFGASMLYHHLLRAGVRIYEYCERPLHSKIALADHEWATVGSSNLDPLSLSLNLEANVIIRDREFNDQLAGRLEKMMRHSCKEVRAEELNESRIWVALRNMFVFHLLRRFPAWAGWLPAHSPKLARAHSRLPDGRERVSDQAPKQGAA